MDIPLDRIEIRVSAENNDARFLGIETTDPNVPFNIQAHIRVQSADATPDQLATLHRYASDRCPLTQLIRTANPVTLVVEDP